MKKIISLIMAVSMLAAMTISASAYTEVNEDTVGTAYLGGGAFTDVSTGHGTGTELEDGDVPLADGPMSFKDVSDTDWFYDAVNYVYLSDIFKGTASDTFSPADKMTKAMLVNALYNMEGTPDVSAADMLFIDADYSSWYGNALKWAADCGIVTGSDSGTFEPKKAVTREELITIIYRYAVYKDKGPVGAWAIQLNYTDLDQVSDYALSPLMWATINNLVKSDGAFRPADTATRAEVATIFMNYDENVISPAASN